ncbi:2-C-methyl-D-erythritol 2,4-cyclodiphosphate synthase [Alicyclobacillus cellulosilyticus]|uniref:2-C-methyl-D-erythritol 2,4-cyclodiphosphate synthase n=1 Tax=Alicyclobacillus cellulosilyticus TaxID=1003997 RepID=A0A917NIY7_9BACL|nr:2-C-methyl-D-erythritol 2,4-cyclodiphosphate synthase [Alicyclobacillus cellulosilyticus]GGJ01265.1 2-C-methyl-D-erythritol 2,4-cyclodiphosphate synthase [Alicyclobacillus cellulosilyticus]
MRVGLGFDVHPYAPDRTLYLGGVEIPGEAGLAGHSDADVVLHAVMDALLGALALGDIGQHFPDSDPLYRGADSARLLERVMSMVAARGYVVGNVDVVVVAEKPRIAPHVAKMRQRMAGLLRCAVEQVSIKATTMERLGFVGREEGMVAQAVVLLLPAAAAGHEPAGC